MAGLVVAGLAAAALAVAKDCLDDPAFRVKEETHRGRRNRSEGRSDREGFGLDILHDLRRQGEERVVAEKAVVVHDFLSVNFIEPQLGMAAPIRRAKLNSGLIVRNSNCCTAKIAASQLRASCPSASPRAAGLQR